MFAFLQDSLKLTAKQKELLHKTVIDEHQPGTILHDFDALLNLVRENKPTLTPKAQLPLKLLGDINSRMKNPLSIGLTRPNQKSYPNLAGLYLVLRASGLTYLDETGKKPKLMVDETLYAQWGKLNPTERYGYLLETWLMRGYEEIINERQWHNLGLPRTLNNIMMFVSHSTLKRFQVAGDTHAEDFIKWSPGLHTLALLLAFGWVDAPSLPAKAGQGWQIEYIEFTELGKAMLALLRHDFFEEIIFTYNEDSEVTFQSLVSPYFPAWQNSLIMSKPETRIGTHIFKVSLGKVWRKIAVDSQATLELLAYEILASVDFDSDHLFEFNYSNRMGISTSVHHPYMDEPPFVTDVLVGDVPLSVGQSMTFIFDFGDHWDFTVQLEAIDPDRQVKGAEIIEVHGEAPPQYEYNEDFEDFDDDDDWM